MNKIRVIDLLNKIANGEEVPKKIKYYDEEFEFTGYDSANKNYNGELEDLFEVLDGSALNDEVEILKEKEICHKCHKYPVEYNQTYCEFCLGISKLEEKKIPEKLEICEITDETISGLRKSINVLNEDIASKINEIIDYLKSKGE